MPSLDILLAFEDYSRVREREYDEQMRRAQVEKTRKERKAREAFRVIFLFLCSLFSQNYSCIQALLQELVEDGKIKARTKWKEVYPLFKDDLRYQNMLGNPGSNPLELFWDTVDGFDQQLDKKIVIVEEAIRRYNDKRFQQRDDEKENGDYTMDDAETHHLQPFSIMPQTTWETFISVVNPELALSKKELIEEDLQLVYQTVSF